MLNWKQSRRMFYINKCRDFIGFKFKLGIINNASNESARKLQKKTEKCI